MERFHNPGHPGDGADVRSKAKAFEGPKPVGDFIKTALARLVGGAPSCFDLFLQGTDSVDEDIVENPVVSVNLYDDAGHYVAVNILGRGVDGHITAVCEDLYSLDGPVSMLLKGVRGTHGVDPFTITLTVTEAAFGLGGIEWSVNL